MAKVTRKQLLTGTAVGAASLVAMPLTGGVAQAASGGHVLVHVHGVVTGPQPGGTAQVAISIDVAGRRKASGTLQPLAGAGWDSGTTGATNMNPSSPNGACYYTQAGSLDEDEVSLAGKVLFQNRTPAPEEGTRQDTRAGGQNVTTVANLKTGAITWTFAGLVFTGTGVVIKID